MNKYFYIVCALLFIIILPLSSTVQFYQNDDWAHISVVRDFLSGNFKLDDYIGPTFYTQGLLGMIFAKIAGIANLPILTLLFSILTLFYIFKILNEFLNVSVKNTILLGLMIYFSPVNMYSLWGFMTEYYLLFFMISSTYYFLKYNQSKNLKDFAICLTLIVAGFFVKQNMLVIPLTFSLYYLLTKDFKNFIRFIVSFLLLAVYYFFVFPKTSAMMGKSFAINHVFEPRYMFAVFYGSLIVLASFILPILLGVIESHFPRNLKNFLVVFFTSVVLLFVASQMYFPHEVSWGEFPYFENTFERTGFYPRGVEGTKYQFRGIFDLYKYWDIAAKLISVIALVVLVLSKKIKLNIYLIFIVLYGGLLVILERYFDRYLVNIIPFAVFYIVSVVNFSKLKLFIPVISAFLLFLIFYTLQFSLDFIKVNNYIWEKSSELVKLENISESKIYASHAWNFNYSSSKPTAMYYFTYDSTKVNPELLDSYTLHEEFKIEYPLNFFIEPKVYLYKKLL